MASRANVLDWLTQPKGPHLVDGASTPDLLTALAILVTPETLYDPDSPRVGLGLIYKAPYIRAASFSEAFFFLKSTSWAEAGNRITSALIIFVQIHESSQVIPLPGVPTLFLDVKTAEDVTDSNEPRPPQDFRGFRLHRVIYLGVGPPAGQVAFPHLQGGTVSHWAPTQKPVMAPELEGMPKLSVALSAAADNHWNIGNDPIFPSCLAKFRARHEASQASRATRSTRRHGIHGESPTSTYELPFPAIPQPPLTPTLGWHEVDEKVTEVMDQLYNLHLKTVQEMGFIQAIDQAMAKSIMVEFLRLRLITGDNLSTTLWTWHVDMEATTEEFLRDLDLAAQTGTTLPSKNAAIEAALYKYQELAKLKLALPLALPLAQLDAAQEEMERFLQHHLEELQSQQETRHLVVELSSKITDHQSRVCQVLRSEPLRYAKVAQLVLVGMAADRPLESNFFPGLLEGLLGRLGIVAPGESKSPTSSQEGACHLWSSAVHEAVLQMEQREVETPGSAGLPQCLDLHYEEDFLEKQSHQVPVVFSDPLFIPSMANAMYKAFKPPVLPKASPFTGDCKVLSISSQPEDSGPKPEKSTPSTPQTSQRVQEQVTKASNTDSDKTDELTPEKEPPPRDLKVKITRRLRKRSSKAMTSSSKDGATPSKVRKELEANDAETTASTGPSEAALQTVRFKLYDKDFPEVKEVHARILGLQEGEEATQEDFDSSPDFQLRPAVNETRPLTVIGEYWIDHLDSKGHLAKCKPNAFKYAGEWLPLYTRAGVTKQISGLGPLLNTQGDSPLIAVIPQICHFNMNRSM